jgi:signal transduction histidine kinase
MQKPVTFPYYSLLAITVLLLCNTASYAQQFNYNFDSLKRVIDQRPHDTASARAYIDYAAKFFYVKSDSGLFYLEKALPLAKRQSRPAVYLYALKNKGDHYSVSGDFKKAASIYQGALNISRGDENWLLKTKIRSNLGTAFKNLGMPDSALLQYQLVEKAFATHRKGHKDSVAMAFSYMQLYDLFQVQGLLEDAIYYGDKGYQLSLRLKFDRGIGYGLFIQALKKQISHPNEALRYADSSLNLAIEKNIPELQQFCRGLKAKILIAQGKYQQAKAVLEPGTVYTAGSAQQVTYAHLAEVYYHLKDLPKALAYFKTSYEMALRSGYHAELADALRTGIAIYEKKQDYKKAHELQKAYQQVQDKIASAKLRLDYQRSAVKFKTAETAQQLAEKQLLIARQENRLNGQFLLITIGGAVILVAALLTAWYLRQQSKLRKQQEIAAKATNEVKLLEAMMQGEDSERERIATDLHDGVGGLLSAVKMRFSTFKSDFQDLKRYGFFEESMLMLDEASADIRRTAHNLMPDMLIKFGLDEAIQGYCTKIGASQQLLVDYQSVGEIGRFQDSFELAAYRMVQELLTNVIKHAQASEVLIQLTKHKELLTISIEDDGKGFEKSNDTKGLGLRSVRKRVQALQGTLEINSSPSKGTAIYIEFDTEPFAKKNDRNEG